ncbi:cupredoxin domain-containing protein [Puerhibacterium puerhi]|uniref:cupredoxin domain-containing protein n=1 Tax=Puerhibacterium puerhi TaxID=2692623 RepID=UPI00135B50CF|nr:cupredoxin domain-containing protein [Puerhibacterium puerhi]
MAASGSSPRTAPRTPVRRWTAVVLALLVAGFVAACSGGSGEPAATAGSAATGQTATGSMGSMSARQPSTPGPGAEQGTVVISGFAFSVPDSVPAGSTVTIRNEDSVEHTVTADEQGGFDVTVDAGQTATMKAPASAGDYPFHCSIHPSMTGTLVVR